MSTPQRITSHRAERQWRKTARNAARPSTPYTNTPVVTAACSPFVIPDRSSMPLSIPTIPVNRRRASAATRPAVRHIELMSSEKASDRERDEERVEHRHHHERGPAPQRWAKTRRQE